jgi:outer membrane protein TolC
MNFVHLRKISTGGLFFMLSLIIPVAQAQTTNPPVANNTAEWSHVIQATVKRHAEYLLYDSQKQVGAGYQQQAKGWLGGDPSISLLHYNDRFASNNGYREWETELELPLWLPGEKSARQRVSDGYFSEAEADLKLLTWKVAGDVQELAWDVYLAQATRKQTYEQWQSTLALENNINRRVKAGELARSDNLLAQQSTLGDEAIYQNALSQLQRAKNAWQNYTGLTIVPVQNKTRVRVNLHSLDEKTVLSQHPLLESTSARTDRTRAQRDDSRIKRRNNPVLGLYTKSERAFESASYENSIGVQISVPFGTRSYAAPRLAEAEAALTEVQVQHLATERSILLQQKQALEELNKTETQLKLATQSNQVAEQRLRLSQRGFDLGETELYLLLLTREQANKKALELEKIKIERQRAINRYNHSYGVIPK